MEDMKKRAAALRESKTIDLWQAAREFIQTDPFRLNQAIVQQAAVWLKVDWATLLIKSPDEGKGLVVRAAWPEGAEAGGIFSMTVLEAAAQGEQPFYSDAPLSDDRLAGAESVEKLNLTMVAAVPLIAASGTVGILAVASFQENGGQPLPVIQAFANLAAAAVENTALHERDRQIISHRPHELFRPLTENDLLAQGLGAYLRHLRARADLSIRQVVEQTGWQVGRSWLSRAERGDIGPLGDQRLRLLALAEVYDVPHETLFLMAGLDIKAPVLPAEVSAWFEQILDAQLIAVLHKLSKLSPQDRQRILCLTDFACDWLGAGADRAPQ